MLLLDFGGRSAGLGRGDGFGRYHLDRLIANEQRRRCNHAGPYKASEGSAKYQRWLDRDLDRPPPCQK